MDEAGRGPLAGPVIAAAVVFMPACLAMEAKQHLLGLTDSKQLSAPQRATFFDLLEAFHQSALLEIGVGCASPADIDRYNIREATHMAMRRALHNWPQLPEHVLVD